MITSPEITDKVISEAGLCTPTDAVNDRERSPFGLTESSVKDVTLTCESFAQPLRTSITARNAMEIILYALFFIDIGYTLSAKVRYFSEKSYLCLLIETDLKYDRQQYQTYYRPNKA